MSKERWLDSRFGKRLRAEREARGWSQPRFAELLEAQGITPMGATTIAKIEGGNRSVRIYEAVGMAEVFGVSLDSLTGRTSGPADADLMIALRVLRDSARRGGDQFIDLREELSNQASSILASFEYESADDLRKLADTARRRLHSAYEAVEDLALLIDEALRQSNRATRKQPTKAKAVRL